MQGASLVLTSYQDSLHAAMDVIANNVANLNTTGFKRETVAFDSYLVQPTPKDSFEFVLDEGTYRDIAQGSFITTGNPLDVAIQGSGYFPVQTDAGVRYTRSGSFQLDFEGNLVTSSGEKVLDGGNQVINFPSDARDILIGGDGTISAKSGAGSAVTEVGRLAAFEFKDEQALVSVGSGFYRAVESPEVSETAQLMQGAVEQSNVKGIEEMTRMIEVSRAYQRVARLLETEQQRQASAIKRLGKITG